MPEKYRGKVSEEELLLIINWVIGGNYQKLSQVTLDNLTRVKMILEITKILYELNITVD